MASQAIPTRNNRAAIIGPFSVLRPARWRPAGCGCPCGFVCWVTAPGQSADTPPDVIRERIRFGPVFRCLLVGVALTGAPFWLEDRWGWVGVTPSTLTNVGTAFLLAGVLFFAERKFVERVTQRTRDVATQTVTAATAGLRQDQSDLRVALNELQGRVRASADRAGSERRDVIAGLSEDVSFDRLTRAFEQVHAVNGFWQGQVTVTADGTPAGLQVNASWSEYADDAWRYEGEQALSFDVDTPFVGGSRRPCEVRWLPDQDAEAFGRALVDEMIGAGLGAQARALDLGVLIGEFQRALALAVASRHHADGGWLAGPLAVLLGPWAVTEAGLERECRGVVRQSDDFPPRAMGSFKKATAPPEPPAPDWCDPGEWEVVNEAARQRHPAGPIAAYAGLRQQLWPVPPRPE